MNQVVRQALAQQIRKEHDLHAARQEAICAGGEKTDDENVFAFCVGEDNFKIRISELETGGLSVGIE